MQRPIGGGGGLVHILGQGLLSTVWSQGHPKVDSGPSKVQGVLGGVGCPGLEAGPSSLLGGATHPP